MRDHADLLVRRLAELLQQLRPQLELAVGRRHIAELHVRHEAMAVAVGDHLAIGERGPERHDFGADLEALLDVVRAEHRQVPVGQHVGQRGLMTHASRHRHGVGAELVSSRSRAADEVQLLGQRAREPCPQRAVVG